MAVLTDKGRRRRRRRAGAEANTHGLPTGEPLRRELVRAFKRQRAAVLDFLRTGRKRDAGPLPYAMPGFDDFGLGALEMAHRMTPILRFTWEKAAAKFAPRVGLDPDAWSVVNPHTAAMIGHAALKFCEKTNETTSLSLNQALAKLREQLRAGVVETGETLEQLTKRVNRVFDGAETWRARRIAQSETSRAVHAAQEAAAVDSGVVRGWEWLASSDACPECLAVAEKARFVRLGQPFAVTSADPVYGPVKFPPLHPHCNCTVLEVLDTDPEPAWSQTLSGSDLKPEAEPEPKPEPKPTPIRRIGNLFRRRKPEPPYAEGVVEPGKQAITLTRTPKDVEKAAAAVLKAMAGFHGMPANMGPNRLKIRNYRPDVDDPMFPEGRPFGYFDPREGQGLAAVRSGIPNAGHTLAHELGHWIDATISKRANREFSARKLNPDLAKFDEAVRRTETAKTIATWLDARRKEMKELLAEKARLEAEGEGDGEFWKEYNKRIKRAEDSIKHGEYLLRPGELWARAYSFLVCRDGGSRALKRALAARKQIEGDFSPHHWTDEDFEPVETEIRAVFDKLDWTRRTPPMAGRKRFRLNKKADDGDDKWIEATRRAFQGPDGAAARLAAERDVIEDPRLIDRRTLQEIADGVEPHYD